VGLAPILLLQVCPFRNPLLPPSSHVDRPSGRSALPWIRQMVTFIGLRKAKAKTMVKTKKIHIQRGMKRKVGSSG